MNIAIIPINGLFMKMNAKTANGLIKGSDKFDFPGVVDAKETAGNDAEELLDGKNEICLFFSDFEEAINGLPVIHFLIIGVATHGWRFIL